MTGFEAVVLTIVTAATPLLIAALGELVTERSGVLNLGVEGMMIVGAVTGFAGAQLTGSPYLGVVAAMMAGIALSSLFGFLVLRLAANHVASGLALTLLGLGLSGMIGEAFIGRPGLRLERIDIPGLSDLPVVGAVLFGQDPLVYASVALAACVSHFLFRTRAGLALRAVGNNHASAPHAGRPCHPDAVPGGAVRRGLFRAGGRLSFARLYPAMGRGHDRGAGMDRACARGVRKLDAAAGRRRRLSVRRRADPPIPCAGRKDFPLPPQLLSALPYIATVAVLVILSRERWRARNDSPACLGQVFVPDR